MPRELIRIASDIRWERTVIWPDLDGLVSESSFVVVGRPFVLRFDGVPDKIFLATLAEIHCLAVFDHSFQERGWVELGRFEIRLNDDNDRPQATALADRVGWGPMGRWGW